MEDNEETFEPFNEDRHYFRIGESRSGKTYHQTLSYEQMRSFYEELDDMDIDIEIPEE